jgi:hypothetical protein
MSRQKMGANDKRTFQRRAFLRATANVSALVATLSTSLGVSISRAVAGSETALEIGKSAQIKWFRSRGGDRSTLREYELVVEEGRALLVTPDRKRTLAKDGAYLMQDGRLIAVSGGRVKEIRAAKGAAISD